MARSILLTFVVGLLCLAALCACFWLAVFLVARSLPPIETARGEVAERLTNFEMLSDGCFQARIYRFARSEAYQADPVQLTLYEGANRLAPANYEIDSLAPQNLWRFVRLRTTDGSNPNTNGRRYFVVLPAR